MGISKDTRSTWIDAYFRLYKEGKVTKKEFDMFLKNFSSYPPEETGTEEKTM